HLVQTEVPLKLLEDWLRLWSQHHDLPGSLRAELRPVTPGSELLALRLLNDARAEVADIVFSAIQDRRGRNILLIRDQNNFEPSLRNKRLMTLAHLFLIHR